MIVRAGSRDYERTQLSEITLKVQDENLVSQTAAMARKLLRQGHPQSEDYEVQVPLELLQQAEREKRIWNLVLGSIAGISLLVGGIGIMNIMLATVSERTREIGIRRALGATRGHIVAQFLVESTVLSSVGGLVGIFLGIAIPLARDRHGRHPNGDQRQVGPAGLRHLGRHRHRVRRLPRPPRRPDGPYRGPPPRIRRLNDQLDDTVISFR